MGENISDYTTVLSLSAVSRVVHTSVLEMEVISVTKKRKNNQQKISGGSQDNQEITVVSKKNISDSKETYEKIKDKFDKIEHLRVAKEQEILDREMSEMNNLDKQHSRVMMVTHVNIVLYSACYWIQSGTLPYLTKHLGADPIIFGHLQTVFSILQLLGGPVYGRIGDIYGEKTALIIAFSSSILTYLMTFLSHSLPVLFLSRLPSVFLHVMQGSQMIMTGVSSSRNRTSALARLGFSYAIGMVVGPTLGGQVTKHWGEHAAALVRVVGQSLV